jgi:hypothetical protein
MCRRNRNGQAKTKLMKLGNGAAVLHALSLIDAQNNSLTEFSQQPGNVVIMSIEASARINHENDDIRLSNRLLSLARHLMKDAGFGYRLKTSCIHDNKGRIADAPLTVVPITGQARKISNQG